ncbi:hypothetical protein C8F01DRAFT_1179133 [Mycena amicta]|nr:hypothetical protein C8F01DRAFT_1179133 [Mycena amicta]
MIMASCSICYERFSAPVSLPCGHIFCRDCLRRTVEVIQSPSIEHFCPACRKPYSVLSIDTALVPPYLRPHILPPIRPVFFDDASPSESGPESNAPIESVSPPSTSPDSGSESSFLPSPSTSSPASQSSLPHTPPTVLPTMPQLPPLPQSHSSPTSLTTLRRTAAEADALRMACQTWRHRAEVHAAANAGLLSFARATRTAAVRMRGERDDARRRVEVLQRQLMEMMAAGCECPPSHGQQPAKRMLPELLVNVPNPNQNTKVPVTVPLRSLPVKRGPSLPSFVVQQRQAMKTAVASWDAEPSLLGPPLKRRKLSPVPS